MGLCWMKIWWRGVIALPLVELMEIITQNSWRICYETTGITCSKYLFYAHGYRPACAFSVGHYITVEDIAIPLWISPVAAVIFVAIAIWLLRERTT